MTPDILREIALRAVELINEQIAEGIDIRGQRYAYSTKPFVRPFDPRIKNIQALVKQGKITEFTSKKTGSLWMYVAGGYKSYREMIGRNPDGDFLTDTGKMLASMSVRVTGEGEAEVYFNEPEAAEQAFWLTVSGAGKSRRLWRFLGLTAERKQQLEQEVAEDFGEQLIVDVVKQFGG